MVERNEALRKLLSYANRASVTATPIKRSLTAFAVRPYLKASRGTGTLQHTLWTTARESEVGEGGTRMLSERRYMRYSLCGWYEAGRLLDAHLLLDSG